MVLERQYSATRDRAPNNDMRSPLLSFVPLFQPSPPASVSGAPPELIPRSGKIVTVDEEFSIEEALAIGDCRIAAVGSNSAGRNGSTFKARQFRQAYSKPKVTRRELRCMSSTLPS